MMKQKTTILETISYKKRKYIMMMLDKFHKSYYISYHLSYVNLQENQLGPSSNFF